MLLRHEIRGLIRGISLLRASLLWHSQSAQRGMEVLSHVHVLNVMHIHVIVRMHVRLNGYHWASMYDVCILRGKLKIPRHRRCIHADVLISRVLINIGTPLHRILWFTTVCSCVRHSLILERMSLRVEWILNVLARHGGAHGSEILVSVDILIHHHVVIVYHLLLLLLLIISVRRWCLVLIMVMIVAVNFFEDFRSETTHHRLS